MTDDDIGEELLLRNTFEVTLNVDLTTAHNMDDETLARILGRAAVSVVREHEDDDD